MKYSNLPSKNYCYRASRASLEKELNNILKSVYQIICSIFFYFYILVVINNIDQISIIECQEAKDLKEMMILIVLHAGRLLVLNSV